MKHVVAAFAACLLSVQLALSSGCGSQTTFTAPGFVQRINSEGVRIRLGARLPRSAGAQELYAVFLPPLPGEPPPAPGTGPRRPARGTLYVYGDTGAAGNELGDCRQTELSCYRASNIVVALQDAGIEGPRLGIAIRRLSE